MSLKGRWRIVEMELWDQAFLDLAEPAYILFGDTGGEFAFGCVTGSFPCASDSEAIAFDWDGADEMEETRGDGWPNSRTTAPSSAKYPSTTATSRGSSLAGGRLLQQPARVFSGSSAN